ncbi:lipid-A-disaccharide synthase [Hydrogenovibrio sp. 3SP14C1]|uniref:lipid-A-disaccharide synthase n=1 Tax=Hydrogenovibrio sp. 3SP14C1 TaxID=3038774 RepID=UPI0024162A40|nr:lipid-A-disaccharide synthase [Hydrogenovibrio sp. 3SP14C1]MDG4812834.1 lipid-A-disaccharide synthase [Hydrogenovibrio sp. 3SP14C1]
MASFDKLNNSSKRPVIAMVAGEASGDTLGADLIQSLKKRYPNAKFIGIGGQKMISQGFETWYPLEKLSVMGFFEVLKHLPSLLRLRKELIKKLLTVKPDVFIGVDAPDFNFKIEGILKEKGISTVHYVGPSVWAWREKRLLKIRKQVDGVLVLFPFETEYYDKYDIPSKFVGHPLASQVINAPGKKAARAQLGLDADAPVTGILPGSRSSEINLMIDVYVQVAVKLHQIYPKMKFVVPCVNQAARDRVELAISDYGKGIDFILLDQNAQLAMAASDQLLVTSGTATLEAALMQRPLILAIKLHPISYWIMKRLATTKWVGLPNVLAKKCIVPELIQENATPDKIVLALSKLITDKKMREMQLFEFKKQYDALNQNASELAADAVVKWAKLENG